LPIAIGFAVMAPLLALMLPFGLRNDFRSDLEHASILRGWPLPPARLVVAELLAPLLLTMLWIWTVLGAVAALVLGLRVSAFAGSASPEVRQPLVAPAFGPPLSALAVPSLLGQALFLPALVAVVLVLQNGAVLAFPAWFPPGARRSRGFEATGTRLIGFF